MGSELAKRVRNTEELIFHTISGGEQFDDIKPRTQLPTRLGANMIVCLANIQTDNFIGKAVLFQVPIQGMTPHDWQDPEHHGVIINKGLIALKNCLKFNQCDCFFTLLEKHLDNNLGMYDHGWRPIKNGRGQKSGLILVRT